MITESKSYCGRISRDELQYYTQIPYLDKLYTRELQQQFFSDLKNMQIDQKKKIIFSINNFLRNTLSRIETVYAKHLKTLDPFLEPISGGHGGYAHSIFGGKYRSFNNSSSLTRQLDERETFIQNYKKDYKILLDKYNYLLNIDATNDILSQDSYINHLKEFKELLFDFILLHLPGRTFLAT